MKLIKNKKFNFLIINKILNWKIILLIVLILFSLFLVSCSDKIQITGKAYNYDVFLKENLDNPNIYNQIFPSFNKQIKPNPFLNYSTIFETMRQIDSKCNNSLNHQDCLEQEFDKLNNFYLNSCPGENKIKNQSKQYFICYQNSKIKYPFFNYEDKKIETKSPKIKFAWEFD